MEAEINENTLKMYQCLKLGSVILQDGKNLYPAHKVDSWTQMLNRNVHMLGTTLLDLRYPR